MTIENAVDAAIRAAGTQVNLAQVLGVTQQAISMWRRRGWVSPLRAQEIEALYGIPRTRLMKPRLVELMGTPEYSGGL